MNTNKPLRILLGPWDKSLEWLGEVDGADIICFGTDAPLPYRVYQDSITDLLARLPDDWQPDVLVLWQPHMNAVPLGWQTLNIPVFAVLVDWQLLGVLDGQLDWLRAVDGIFLDRGGVDYLQANGFQNAWHFLPSSFVPALNYPDPHASKIYDISFAGSLAHPIHRQRGRRLCRVAKNLGGKYRVGFFDWALKPAQYARVIQQSRIVFNYSYRGELNIRCYEAMAGGALLFLEDTNLDIPGHFQDGVHYVSYNDANCLQKLEYYLSHEDEQQKIAQAGQLQVQKHTNAAHLIWLVKQIKIRLQLPRQANPAAWTLRRQGLNYSIDFYSAMTPQRAESIRTIWEQARAAGDDPAWLDAALASVAFRLAKTQTGAIQADLLAKAVRYLHQAITLQPDWVWLHWSAGQLYFETGQQAEAEKHFRRAIQLLQTQPQLAVAQFGPYIPYAYDHFMVSWLETNIQLGKGQGDKTLAWAELLEAQCQSMLAKIYVSQRQWLAAKTALHRAIELRPDMDNLYHQLADVLVELREFAQAEIMIEKSLNSNEFNITAWFLMIDLLLQTRHYIRCGDFCRERLRFITSFPDFKNIVARLEELCKQADDNISLDQDYIAGKQPPGKDQATGPLTSIIILTHNRLEDTQLCLQSIELHTPEPHELIIVDNGSTDGTLDYLRQYQSGHPNVRVIANKENLGFAAGNNQGLALAKGNYILLLNNDTIVTSGWLGRMQAVFTRHPDVGLVGPVTNNISGPQKIETNYHNRAEMDSFAAQWIAEHAAQTGEFSRLVGFCLLARRAVIDRIGGLDERYGSGNFEDDDFCLRAAALGFKARIAVDSFVHHTGSQTFKSMGIDYNHSLNNNWALFKSKWGIAPDVPYGQNYWSLINFPEDTSVHFIALPAPSLVLKRVLQPAMDTLLLVAPAGQSPADLARFVQLLEQALPEPGAINLRLVGAARQDLPPTGLAITPSAQTPVAALAELLAGPAKRVVLLSTDVTLTPDTLPALLSVADSAPTIAAVGPVSNAAPAAQRIADPSAVSADPAAWTETLYLGGFCLLLKSHAVRVVGGLNAALPLAEALLDLYGRLKNAGFKRVVAQGVYVQHETLSVDEGAWYDDLAALQQQINAALAPGQAALANNDPETAVAEFTRAAETHPQLAAVQVALAQTLLALGRADQSVPALTRAIDLVPQDPSLRLLLGDALAQSGEGDSAAECYRQASALDKTQVAPLVRLAELHRSQQRYQAAAEVVKTALAQAPADVDVLALYGRLMLDIGDIEGAELAWERLADAPANHPGVAALLVGLVGKGSLRLGLADFLAQVESFQQAQDWAGAAALLKDALRYAQTGRWMPADAAVLWNKLGLCYFNLNHFDEAGVAFEQALGLTPDDPDVLSNAAHFYAAQEQYDLATGYINRLMKIAPNDVNNLLLLGDVAIKLGELDTALMAFQKVQHLAPKTPGVDDVLRELEIALSGEEAPAEPFDLEAALAPVQAAQNSGDWPQAKILLSEMTAHPAAANNPLVWNQLGLACYLTDDLAGAENAFTRALSLDGQNFDALSNLANLYIRREDYDSGTDYLNRALAIRPDDVNLLLTLGNVAVELGVFDTALMAFRRVQQLAPQTEGIAEVIAQLEGLQ